MGHETFLAPIRAGHPRGLNVLARETECGGKRTGRPGERRAAGLVVGVPCREDESDRRPPRRAAGDTLGPVFWLRTVVRAARGKMTAVRSAGNAAREPIWPCPAARRIAFPPALGAGSGTIDPGPRGGLPNRSRHPRRTSITAARPRRILTAFPTSSRDHPVPQNGLIAAAQGRGTN